MEDNESQADRIQYLRERGVKIEFPEDRNKVTTPIDVDSSISYVKVVKIPCKITDPYSEIEVPIDTHNGDKLLNSLKQYFTSVMDGIDEAAIADTLKTLHTNASSESIPRVTLSTLAKTSGTSEGSVEAFPLTHPNDSNNYEGINIYLDEVGQLKHLPSNERAIQLATYCGFDNISLVGDIFIGRITVNQSNRNFREIIHKDFTLSELNSGSNWLLKAKNDNFKRGLETNRVAMSHDIESDNMTKMKENIVKGYKWIESYDSIEIIYKLPVMVESKRDIKVIFHSKSVIITSNKTSEVLLNIKLFKNIEADECTWTSSDVNNEIEITLEKLAKGMWNQLEVD